MGKEPLAAQLRPETLDVFVGQRHLVGEGKPLRVAIEKKHAFSFVLWGPPGVGKTTLARIYAHSIDAQLFELSAVSAGKDDIRKIIHIVMPARKVLFLDEIHRFNKAQQDFLLPYVESGELLLVGATTENPSFEVIPALLSRCRVFVLNPLSDDEMKIIFSRTHVPMNEDAQTFLINMANGDARQALTVIDATHELYGQVTVESLKDAIQSKFLRYDKAGEEHYNVISAFIKSMRASQPDAALYYLARMIDGGEDPLFIARRMVIFASEDVGMAQPTALVVANEVFNAVQKVGLPEAQINLAHGTVYLSLAPKSRASYEAYFQALEDVKQHGNLSVPLAIRNAPTTLMKDLGYGKDYEQYTKEELLPEKLKGKTYFTHKKNDLP